MGLRFEPLAHLHGEEAEVPVLLGVGVGLYGRQLPNLPLYLLDFRKLPHFRRKQMPYVVHCLVELEVHHGQIPQEPIVGNQKILD